MRTLSLLRDDASPAKLEGGVKNLAKEVGVTPSYLCRVFKSVMGCTMGQYCRQFDEEQAVAGGIAGRIRATALPQQEVTISAGLPMSYKTPEEPPDHTEWPTVLSDDFVDYFWTFPDKRLDTDLDFDEWLCTSEGAGNDSIDVRHGSPRPAD